MSSSFNLSSQLKQFSGWAPLFPLPNVVFFPHILLPLHVFEPRYRQMVADVLEGDRLIATALMQPGWDRLHPGENSPVHQTVCLGRISVEDRLPDGCYNLVLAGLSRARIIEEKQEGTAYRVGRLELCADRYPVEPIMDSTQRRMELITEFRNLLPQVDLDHIFNQAMGADMSLGILCDILAYALPLDPVMTQEFLEELDVRRRSELVLRRIRELLECKQVCETPYEFPPRFSLN
jgi:uncharacterized protein